MKLHHTNRYWIGFLLLVVITSACNRPIPTAKRLTDTPVPASIEPLAATRTSLAGKIIATLTADQAISATQQVTSTPIEEISPSVTPIPGKAPETAVIPGSTVVVVQPPGSSVNGAGGQKVSAIPEFYVLHRGEFPWCLARRFNINPRQIMKVNGFFYGQIYYPGQVVWLPHSPRPFLGNRALRPHPTTYRVGYQETIYMIACYFGDIDPSALAESNGIVAPYHLTAGQVLSIP